MASEDTPQTPFPPQHQDRAVGIQADMTPQPSKEASAYVCLASDDSGYVSGQIIHANGGSVVNG